jgi:hypothetical protein
LFGFKVELLMDHATVVGDNTQQRPGLRGTPARAEGSFIEDFGNTPDLIRKYYIRSGMSYDINFNQWHEWKTQKFKFNEADSNKAINAGTENNSFFLQSGGNTKLTLSNGVILTIK